MLYQCVADYTVLTEQVHYDEKTRSTPADDATDINNLRMEFRTSGVKACLCDHHHSAGDMDDCTSQFLMNLYSKN